MIRRKLGVRDRGTASERIQLKLSKQFTEYPAKEQQAGQQGRGCVKGGSGWGLFIKGEDEEV